MLGDALMSVICGFGARNAVQKVLGGCNLTHMVIGYQLE